MSEFLIPALQIVFTPYGLAVIFAGALFGIFCWVSGFSAVTMWFLLGAGANFVRCLFLAFYGVKKPVPEGYGYIYAR